MSGAELNRPPCRQLVRHESPIHPAATFSGGSAIPTGAPSSVAGSDSAAYTFPAARASARILVRWRDDTGMKKSESKTHESPSRLIDARIRELGDWRGTVLGRLRALVKDADPDVIEEWKWRGVPVWSHDGILCTGETYKNAVKMTFAKGAALEDPAGLFNSSLDGNTRRAIDFHEGDAIDEKALKALVGAAVALNTSKARTRKSVRLADESR
jgi:hypothetical protein